MRLSNTQAVARPVYGDRNPINRTQYVNSGGIAPHVFTTRWTYTVPAGKKAQVDTLFAFITRQAAAAPVGVAAIQIAYTPSGGALALLDYIYLVTNGVNDTVRVSHDGWGLMLTGDSLSMGDSDTSTGGTVQFIESAKIFEFDA